MRMTGLSLLLLAGCVGESVAPPPPPAPQLSAETRARIEAIERQFTFPGTVTARLGEEVRLGDIRIRPLELLEDSRCPLDVTCVWAGRVRLRVAISTVGEQVMGQNQPIHVSEGRSLRLVAVAPPPWRNPPPGYGADAPKRFAFSLS